MLWTLSAKSHALLIFNSVTIERARHFAGSSALERHLRKFGAWRDAKLIARPATESEAHHWKLSVQHARVTGRIHATWDGNKCIWTVPL